MYTSAAIGTDGFPVISSYDSTNRALKVARCGNAACSSGNTVTIVDSTGDVGWYTSIAIGTDGYPVISYFDYTNYDLKVAKCGNADCSSGNTIASVGSSGYVRQYTSIAIGTDGFPMISYYDYTNADLKVVKCGNATCSSGNTITTVDSTGNVGQYTSIAIGSDGYPVISYNDYTNYDVKVAKCGSAACNSPAPTGSLANSRALYLGDCQGANGGDEFNGDIDEVRIFRSAMNPAQVQVEYNLGATAALGSTGTTSTGAADNSQSREYCVPGDTSTCNPPVGRWTMDGPAYDSDVDSSGNGLPGIDQGGTTVSGVFGNAIHLETASTEMVRIYDNALLRPGSSAFTTSVWAKIPNVAQIRGIYEKINLSTNQGYALVVSDSATFGVAGKKIIVVNAQNGSNYRVIETINDIVDGNWHHYEVVADPTVATVTLYVDGQIVPQTLYSVGSWPNMTNTEILTIGRGIAGMYLTGDVDEFRYYNYARTPAQVAWDYNRGGPVAWYRMDECTGTTINDASGKGLNGTLTNATPGTCSTSGSWYNGATGAINSSLDFDGSDDYVSMGALPILSEATQFTVSAWFRTSTLDGGSSNLRYIVSQYTVN